MLTENCGEKFFQYMFFGDAITFHTTYKTNLYDMLSGLFVVDNSHFESIILASVIVHDKQVESFFESGEL
jgi:hypothetical protein